MGRRQIEPEQEPKPLEYWRDIPGYEGEYQASTEGRIRQRRPDGSGYDLVHIVVYKNRRSSSVYLLDPDGRKRMHMVLRIVGMTWWPDRFRPELDVIHKNGMHTDNSAYNCDFVTRAERMRRVCSGRLRRAVLHIGPDGKILDIYPSVTAAGNANGITASAVYRHCVGSRRRADGTTFRYEEMKRGRPCGRP